MMIISGSAVKPSINLVRSKYTGKWWLEKTAGEKLTPKFYLNGKDEKHGFVILSTNIGNYVYHKMQDEILYSDSYPNNNVNVTKLSEHLCRIYVQGRGISLFYTQYGRYIRELGRSGELKNGLIWAYKNGKYGFIDEDANDVVPFVYTHVNSFNEYGYAIVQVSEEKYCVSLRTVIDKEGKQLFEPIECHSLDFISEDRIAISGRKGHGIIDLTGKEIVPAIYSLVNVIGDFYKVVYNNKWGLFSKNGETLLETIYDEIIETPDKFVVKDFAKIELPKLKEIKKRKEE